MIYDIDVRRANLRLRQENRELREIVLTLLEAPFEGLVPWARTFACGHRVMGHPVRKSDGMCYCDSRRVATRR